MRSGAALLAMFALLAVSACGADASPGGVDSARAWAEAQRRWHEERDPLAWRAWAQLDPGTSEGREARRLLAEADALYREGIARVDSGAPDARRSFEEALLLAPMDPRLNLPLARAFRRRADLDPENPHLFVRAAFTYRKFL